MSEAQLARLLRQSAEAGVSSEDTVNDQLREAETQVNRLRLRIKAKLAREDYPTFLRMLMPDPTDPLNPDKTEFITSLHHQMIFDALAKVESGECKRLIITMPPRHGKSQMTSKGFIPWYAGRNPNNQIIFSTYNQTFADDFGRYWRDAFRSPAFKATYPGVELRKDSAAVDRQALTVGGKRTEGALIAVGAGGAVTGRGAHLLVIDDPIKNYEESQSQTTRDALWGWYQTTAYTRLMPGGAVIVIMTRWNEDDLVGRLLSEEYSGENAKDWEVLNLPAIRDNKPLWPEWFDMERLDSIRTQLGPANWSALYMQQPSPEDGLYFLAEDLIGYDSPEELPRDLRIYAASDHALGMKKQNDFSVYGSVGVDSDGVCWVLPTLRREQVPTDVLVERMIDAMERDRPMIWWMEQDLIAKSIGPFLRKRMQERKTFVSIHGQRPATDKVARSASVQGRVAMRMVRFPTFAPWWPSMRSELLSFPNGKNDDFVDWLSWIGLGLDIITPAERMSQTTAPRLKTGTLAWVKQRSASHNMAARAKNAGGGW